MYEYSYDLLCMIPKIKVRTATVAMILSGFLFLNVTYNPSDGTSIAHGLSAKSMNHTENSPALSPVTTVGEDTPTQSKTAYETGRGVDQAPADATLTDTSKLHRKLAALQKKRHAQPAPLQEQSKEIQQLRISQTKQKAKKKPSTTPHNKSTPKVIFANEGGNEHSPTIMASVRIMKVACLLSSQKASLAMNLMHHCLTGEAPCPKLGTTTSISPHNTSQMEYLSRGSRQGHLT